MTTTDYNTRCHAIIHTAAVACGAGNAVPGLGVAADVIALTGMAVSLAAVFGEDLPKSAAKALAVSALKKQVLKQPVKYAAAKLSSFVPWVGQVLAPTVSAGLVEATGWAMVKQFETGRFTINC